MHSNNLIFEVTHLILQLGVIILASWLGRIIAKKIKLPAVVCFILIGIILGPFLLGGIPLAEVYPQGLFPSTENAIPISPYLYSFSVLASILLLFMSGLETDTDLFVRYSLAGTVVGMGGLIFSFAGGYLVSILTINHHLLHPVHLFMGTVATATSVGISTAVLSDQNKINSPEGVTILSAAVLDDVLGIIVLAIIIGITDKLTHPGAIEGGIGYDILITSVKAIGIWLGCTLIGIIFSRKIGHGLKRVFKDTINIAVISVGLALLLGSMFEFVGLSVVIGAYIMGITLSNTDLSYVIQEKITPITTMLTPIFFIVTGMIINLNEILNWNTVVLGLLYAGVCIISKIIGGGVPALSLGFNHLGAFRIGVGMAPRGEIALIISGIGISMGILSDKMFGAILIMILTSSILSPFLLSLLLHNEKSGRNKEDSHSTLKKTIIDLKNESLKRLILIDFLQLVEEENFYISRTIQKDKTLYHIRRDDIFLTLTTDSVHNSNKLVFETDEKSIAFIKTALYEASANLAESAQLLKHTLDPKNITFSGTTDNSNINLKNYISTSLVKLQLVNTEKEKIIEELVELMDQEDLFKDKNAFLQEVLERERTFSTGFQEGIALPHAKTQHVKKTSVVVGLAPQGVDFESLDGKPSKIIILLATTRDTPHLSLLTKISSLLNSEELREQLLKAEKRAQVIQLLTTQG